MTVTIKRPAAAAILIALIGVCGGLALGQVTQATSAGNPQAEASYVSPLEHDVKKMARQLGVIKAALGEKGYIDPDILGYLKEIRGNTYGTCQALGGSPFCHN